MLRMEPFLFLVGMFVCFMDIPNIPVGGVHLKMPQLVFPLYMPLLLLRYKFRVKKHLTVLGALFLSFLLPSVLFSTNIKISLEYLYAAVISVIIMNSMYRLATQMGSETVELMLWFYRWTVITTVPLVAFRLQERGHYTLYEASYWAIALIPYYCISFNRLFDQGRNAFLWDGLIIVLALVTSSSVSMAIWIVISFLFVAFAKGRLTIKTIVTSGAVIIFLLVGAWIASDRVQSLFQIIADARDWSALPMLLVAAGGNRLQRILIAYRAFVEHPIVGVGPGALLDFASLHYRASDFSIGGMAASDFNTDLPATNAFLELAAEAGIIGFAAFLTLLWFVLRRSAGKPPISPFRISVVVTMLSLTIESSYLRPYVWMLYGITLGLSDACCSDALDHGSLKRILARVIYREDRNKPSAVAGCPPLSKGDSGIL